jgi:hypothetical protein
MPCGSNGAEVSGQSEECGLQVDWLLRLLPASRCPHVWRPYCKSSETPPMGEAVKNTSRLESGLVRLARNKSIGV